MATPYRQIRAHQTPTTITLYQAYHPSIASAALASQNLAASPDFRPTRMTWVKPSWSWMMYRSGYSHKDARQARILALSVRREVFIGLLRRAVVASASNTTTTNSTSISTSTTKPLVRVQWDPERSVRLEALPWRSIQVGVSGSVVQELVDGIVRIEDVTQKARALKAALDEDVAGQVGVEELMRRGLLPEEVEFEVDDEIRRVLGMGPSVN